MSGYIYKITNDINNKVYIGKTTLTIEERFKTHIKDSHKRKTEKRPLYNAMNKYGTEHFFIEEVEEVQDVNLLSEREQYWISYYDSYSKGYNATLGGDSKLLYNYAEIIQLFQQGYLVYEIAKKIGCSVDTVSKVLKSNHIDSTINQRKRSKKKPVIAYNDTKEIHFNSSMDAARWLIKEGITKAKPDSVEICIGRAAKDNQYTSYGFHWRYADSQDEVAQ